MMQFSPRAPASCSEPILARPGSPLPAAFRYPDGLTLRPRCGQDSKGLFALLSQQDFQRHGCTLDTFTSIDDLEAFVSRNGPNAREIVATIRDTIVGYAGTYLLPGRQAHVGSFTLSVHEDFQTIGVGTVLMKALVGAGFHLLGLQRIQATVFTDNERALSLYRRFGFMIEGRLARFARRDDGFIDAYLIALIRASSENEP